MPKFADWLFEQRKNRDWSRAEFAKKTGNAPRSVETWEREGVIPHPNTLRKIAEVLRVEEEVVIAIANGRPIPEPERLAARRIEVSEETVEALEIQSAGAGMSVGRYVELLARVMESPTKWLVRAFAATSPGGEMIQEPATKRVSVKTPARAAAPVENGK